jgi:hypothetical protein
MTTLADFFTEMVPFLRGETSAEAVLERLGPSPSGTARFALYAELVARQRRAVIDHFYRAVAAAATFQKGDLFAQLRDDYLRSHPPGHWSPNQAARAFPAYLAGRSDLTPELAELADYAWIRYAAMHARHEDRTVGLDEAVFVRHYESDVVTFSSELDERGAGASLLSRTPCTLLVARHRRAGTLVITIPSLAALVSLATMTSDAGCAPTLPASLRWDDVMAGAEELEMLGVVPQGIASRIAHREVS